MENRELTITSGNSGPAIKAGHSRSSLLIALVAGVDPENVMPQKGSRLTKEQVGLLRAWIDQGVTWDAKVTFGMEPTRNLQPVKPTLPTPRSSDVDHPVDRIVDAYFGAQGRGWPEPVDDRTFIRRAFFDVIGLMPAGDEVEAFCADASPTKRAALIRALLNRDDAYAEHWLSFWNDMLRNDYRGTGYIDGGRKQISKWLYRALADNMPYDRFVAGLIAPGPGSEGFVKGIVWRGVVNASQTPSMQAAQNISQVFMGVNLKCASCHDSFINDWSLSDAYALANVYADEPLELFHCDKPTGQKARMAFIFPELGAIDPALDKPSRLKRLAEVVTRPENGRLSRTLVNRLWGRFFGRGLVEPVDEMEKQAWSPELIDWLAEDFVAHGWDLKHAIATILTSRAYQLPAFRGEADSSPAYVFKGPQVRRLTAEQYRDALGQITRVWGREPAGDFGFSEATRSRMRGTVRASLLAADPLTTALGRPNREQVMTFRVSGATTLQALELTNGETLSRLLHAGARTLLAAGRDHGTEAIVRDLFREALGRPPSSSELEFATETVGNPATQLGMEDLLWSVAMLPEFQLLY